MSHPDTSKKSRVEKSFLDGESPLKTILYSMQTGIVILDVETHQILDVNKKAIEMIGATKDQICSSICHEYICPAEKGHCPVTDLGQEVDNSERVLIKANGERMPIIKTVVTAILEGRKCLIESFIDITERKRLEGALMKAHVKLEQRVEERTAELRVINEHLQRQIVERKRAEEALLNAAQQWRTTFDGISDIVCLLDPEGRILRCNKAMVNLLGKPFSEILSRPYWEIVHGTTAPIKECPVVRMRETRRRETTILSIDDRWFSIAVDPLLNEAGVLIGAVHIMSDITERKQAEEAIRRSEEKYRTILENIEDGYYEVDIAGNFTFFNDSICRIWGYPKEELMGMNNRQYTDQENAKKLFQAFNKVCRTGEPTKEVGWEIIRKDGTKRYIEASVSLQKNSSDKPIGFRGIIRDITERKRVEEERLALQEQFRQSQKMESVGQLAGGVAHDFNNLLTVITGYSDLILRRIDQNDSIRGDAEEIKRSAEKAASLTRQLLAFSRKQVLEPKVLDLNHLVANMHKMLQRLIGEDIELVTLLTKDLRSVKVDPGQIEQVILNLAVNARDAMPDGGKLTIETANAELDGNYARTHIGVTPGRFMMLSVSDTGHGMTPEIRERIFEPFFTTKEKDKGTGLGLSTVYGIIKQSGGNILVYSEPGQGTTFKIYLPMIEETTDSLGPSIVSTKPLEGSETVLLVEDEEAVRKLIHAILRNYGYKVLEAANGEEALRIAHEQPPQSIQLMLTDVVMPRMSGRELADCLKSVRPEMKVLYMSGYTSQAVVHHGVLDPATAYIQKPFTSDALASKVRDVLDTF